MSKVLSIELGFSLVRVLEIDYKAKKPKIYANFEFKTPENVLEDGFIKQPLKSRNTKQPNNLSSDFIYKSVLTFFFSSD